MGEFTDTYIHPHASHYTDVIMTTIASQITSLMVVYSTVYSDADQRKHQCSASLAFVRGIHRDRWIPRTKGQLRGKCFHLMTSSWICWHYSDDIMGPMASPITSLTLIYSTVYSGADYKKHQSSPSLAFVRGIHRWPVKSPHKGPVTRKMFPFDDVIMEVKSYFTIISSPPGTRWPPCCRRRF